MYFIKQKIFDDIVNTIGYFPIESGGIIGIKGKTICKYYFDKDGYSDNTEYIPDVKTLNKIISNWAKSKIQFAGIVHSHPNCCNIPSRTDFDYAKMILANNRFIDRLIFPILTKDADHISITFYEFIDDFSLIEVQCI